MDFTEGFDTIMERVELSIERFQTDNSLRSLTREDLTFLPKQYMFHHNGREILKVWDNLPKRVTQDLDRNQFKHCTIHYNNGRTHIDGLAPIRLNCVFCKQNHV